MLVSDGIREEPDEFPGLVVGVDEFLEGVVDKIVAEHLEFVGLCHLVNLHDGVHTMLMR